MRVWQLLACIALVQIAVSTAFTFPSSHEAYSSDLEVAASGHKESHSSGFEEDGGSEHGAEHHSKVSDRQKCCKILFNILLIN